MALDRVEAAAAGHQAQLGSTGGVVDVVGGEARLGVLLDPVDGEPDHRPVGPDHLDLVTHHVELGPRAAAAAWTVPVALFLLATWALQVRPHHLGRWHAALVPVTAVLVLAATLGPEPVLATGLLLAAMTAASLVAASRSAGL